MRPDVNRLGGVTESVADGSAIDWGRIKATASEPERASIIEQLQVIERIAALHRSAQGPGTSADPDRAAPELRRGASSALSAGGLGEWRDLRLLEEIGRGAFGIVYRAYDPRLDIPVAVKLLQRTARSDDELVSRLLREGRTLARMRHPNIVIVHGASTDEGQVGLWMEFIRGQTLEQMLATHGAFSAAEAGHVGYELCGALAAVHAAGLVHRDVKAHNVMREEGGRVVLVDFGATERRNELSTIRGRLAGTPLYLAPEILNGAEASPQSDVYSLGVLLYHLASDDFPVKAPSIDGLIRAHARGDITPLSAVRPNLPPTFLKIIDRATHRSPSRRYESAEHLREALARFRPDKDSGTKRRIVPPQRGIRPSAVAAAWPGSPSIAVLPFTDMSAAKDQESFCDGLTEELIGALTQIRGMQVVARASAFQFKGSVRDIRQIGDVLGVAAVLDGSVRRHGDQLRIKVELIGASHGYLLWSRSFDRKLEDIFAVQDEIAASIAGTLKGGLPGGLPATTLTPRSRNFEAYASYLEGRYHWNKRTEDSLKRSVSSFERSIEKDPGFAPAHAALADAYVTLGTYGCLPANEVMPRAMESVERALTLDANLAEAYTCRACIRAVYEWSWRSAERDFKQAIEINPSYPTARHWYAINHLAALGRSGEADDELRRALELDPLSLAVKTSVGMNSYFAKKYDDAVHELQRVLELDDAFGLAHLFLGATYTEQGRYPEALAEIELARRLSGNGAEVLAALGYLHGRSGRTDAARRALDELWRLARERYVSPARLAQVHVSLGESSEALAQLERAQAERAADLAWVGVRPVFADLMGETRFQAIRNTVTSVS